MHIGVGGAEHGGLSGETGKNWVSTYSRFWMPMTRRHCRGRGRRNLRAQQGTTPPALRPPPRTLLTLVSFFFFLIVLRKRFTRELLSLHFIIVRVVFGKSQKENLISRTCARFHAMCVPTSTNLSHKEGGLHITSYSGYYTSQSNGDCSATG